MKPKLEDRRVRRTKKLLKESFIELMSEKQIRRIPVTQNNKVIGILTLGDLAANQSVDQKELCDTIECICGTDEHNAE